MGRPTGWNLLAGWTQTHGAHAQRSTDADISRCPVWRATAIPTRGDHHRLIARWTRALACFGVDCAQLLFVPPRKIEPRRFATLVHRIDSIGTTKMAFLSLPTALITNEQATLDPTANQSIFRARLPLLTLAPDHQVLASSQSSTRFNGIAGTDVSSTQTRVRHQAPS